MQPRSPATFHPNHATLRPARAPHWRVRQHTEKGPHMSRVSAPLLSFEASGQIAKTQVYSKWKGRPYVRRYTIPSNPNTASQQATRSTFSFLNNVYAFMPGDGLLAWEAYADVSRFTGRNGFIKQNLAALIGESDLTNFVFSPAARGGIVASSLGVTPGNDQLAVTLVAPTLPSGWSIAKAIWAIIRQQDPQTGVLYPVTVMTDESTAYGVTFTGLASAETYVIGGWFEYTKPDETLAYGRALMSTGLTT